MGAYDTTLGTLLIGAFFNTFLYGLVTYQFAVYHRTKFNDRAVTKCMVAFLFLLDTFHSASIVYMVWYYAVTNFGNPVALSVGVWPYPFTAIATALVATVTQLYLGFRIWCLTNSKILYGVVIVLAIPSLTLGFVCGIFAWIIHITSEMARITPLVIVWWSFSVTTDVFITITLVIAFTRSRTRFRKTDSVINRLIRGAIQTGLFASIFALGDLITFVTLPNMNLYGMFAIPLGRIYTNVRDSQVDATTGSNANFNLSLLGPCVWKTLMDTLLTRESIRAALNSADHVIGELRASAWESTQSSQTMNTELKVYDATDTYSHCVGTQNNTASSAV